MHRGTCVKRVPWCMTGSLTSGFIWSRWQGKRSRYSRRMRNPQFYVSGKRPMGYSACTHGWRESYYKTNVHLDHTDLHQVNWHSATHGTVRPSGTRWQRKMGVKEPISREVLYWSHAYKSNTTTYSTKNGLRRRQFCLPRLPWQLIVCGAQARMVGHGWIGQIYQMISKVCNSSGVFYQLSYIMD